MLARRFAVAAALLAISGETLVGCSSGPSPRGPATAYLTAWSKRDIAAAGADTSAPADARTALQATAAGLGGAKLTATLKSTKTSGSSGTAGFTATLRGPGAQTWSYDGTLSLRKNGKAWQVQWTPTDIHPALRKGQHLALLRTQQPRAALLADDNAPLFAPTPVVTIGVQPDALKDKATTLATLAAATGADAAKIQAAIGKARRGDFVPVITLRRTDYDAIRARVHALPGVRFQTSTLSLAPTASFGRAVLGRVGQISAEQLKKLGAGYAPGDTVGLYGLQAAYEKQLAGTPSGSVVVADSIGTTVTTLHTFAGQPGTPVKTALAVRIQRAAEAALAKVGKPAALVVVRPSTGAVLADAVGPSDTTFDRGLDGRYPPGSTFKVVSSYALLGAGVTPQTPIACPPSVTVDGRKFKNFEGETSGPVPFTTDFAKSCNAAFVTASSRLSTSALPTAGGAFGLGSGWKLPVPSYDGSVPAPSSTVEKAAATIGQGRVLVSPLAMALTAAAVSTGTWRPPVLVTDPATPSTVPPRPLDPARAAQLRALMRAVVTSGTAASAGLPAGVSGKTGTAEFGTDNPPKTHAWFIGFDGDLAFAVVVEGGGVGGRVAAPIAAALLRSLGPR